MNLYSENHMEDLFTGVGEWLQDMNKPHSYHSKILVINPWIPESNLASCENGVFLSAQYGTTSKELDQSLLFLNKIAESSLNHITNSTREMPSCNTHIRCHHYALPLMHQWEI